MSRGGKALRRRKAHALYSTAGKTGSHRNAGDGFSRIPIAERHRHEDVAPRTFGQRITTAPDCDRDHRMHLESGQRGLLFWVCRRCRQAIAYKPLRTGLKSA